MSLSASSSSSSTSSSSSGSSSSSSSSSSSEAEWDKDATTLSRYSRVHRVKHPSVVDSSSSSSSDEEKEEQQQQEQQSLSPPPFRIDEKVFAVDHNRHDRFYPAVIRQARHDADEAWEFQVHYSGWNARFDRWLAVQWIRPYTAEQRALYEQQEEEQKQIKQQQEQQQQQQQQASKKRKQSHYLATTSTKSTFYYSDYCAMPLTLRSVLVEEAEKVTRRGWDAPFRYDAPHKYKRPCRMLHLLPAALPVRKVLKAFRKDKRNKLVAEEESKNNNNNKDTVLEQVQAFCQQLGQLFQDALPVCLLYPEERPQYELWRREYPDASVLDVYGCEYLLRLYVRLPVLLQHQNADTTTGPFLSEMMVLMQKNRNTLFKANSYRPVKREEWTPLEKNLYDKTRKIEKAPTAQEKAAT